MIRIIFKNGKIYEWGDGRCRDYKYDGKCFIVIGNNNDLGIYNIDDVSSVEVASTPAGGLPEGDGQESSQHEPGLPVESQEEARQEGGSQGVTQPEAGSQEGTHQEAGRMQEEREGK